MGDPRLNLSRRLPANIKDLKVLNLGAGYCASPVSGVIPLLPFRLLVNIEIWPDTFLKLNSLTFASQYTVNEMTDVMNYVLGHSEEEDLFDVVLMLDVLEHFEKEKALTLLSMCRHISKRVVIWLPIGTCKQDDPNGNPYQTHLSTWVPEDFKEAQVEHFPKFHLHFAPPVDAAWVIYDK